MPPGAVSVARSLGRVRGSGPAVVERLIFLRWSRRRLRSVATALARGRAGGIRHGGGRRRRRFRRHRPSRWCRRGDVANDRIPGRPRRRCRPRSGSSWHRISWPKPPCECRGETPPGWPAPARWAHPGAGARLAVAGWSESDAHRLEGSAPSPSMLDGRPNPVNRGSAGDDRPSFRRFLLSVGEPCRTASVRS